MLKLPIAAEYRPAEVLRYPTAVERFPSERFLTPTAVERRPIDEVAVILPLIAPVEVLRVAPHELLRRPNPTDACEVALPKLYDPTMFWFIPAPVVLQIPTAFE